MNQEPIKIALVDDHAIIRHALTTIISTDNHYDICFEASHFEEAVEKIKSHSPDIVVLDISLQSFSGLDLLLSNSSNLTPKYLVFSMYDEEEFLIDAISRGAHGYLSKDCSPKEILLALKTVSSGAIYLQKRFAHLTKDIEELRKNFPAKDCALYHPLSKLSKREREVFFHLVSGKPNRVIAKQLFLSPRTVETHRSRLIKKLGLGTTADLVRFAIKNRLLKA